MTHTTRKVPASALTMSVGDFVLGNNGGDAKTAPFKMVARSGQPIDHPYWGKIAHDLAGMTMHKARLPIDYAHDDAQVIGYANRFDISSGDLVATGALVPFSENDKASEVIFKARAGVPYEASINFGGPGIQIEEVAEGGLAQVNGYTFAGPGLIVRQWPLRGIAVCPYGADHRTSTELSSTAEIEVTLTAATNGATMTLSTTSSGEAPKAVEPLPPEALKAVDGAPAETGTQAPAPAPVVDAAPQQPSPEQSEPVVTQPAPEVAAPEIKPEPTVEPTPEVKPELTPEPAPVLVAHQPYIELFGDRGAVWFLAGKPMADCVKEFLVELKTLHAATVLKLEQEKTELQARLDALPRGNKPVAFSPAEKAELDADPVRSAIRIAGRKA